MSRAQCVEDGRRAAFVDEMADQLLILVQQAEQGDRLVEFPIRFILASASGLWGRHPFLAMRAERVCLAAAGERLLDGLRRQRLIITASIA
jgi:hypothetical protein